MDEKEKEQIYIIPNNVNENGNILMFFKTRNLAEALVVSAVLLVLWRVITLPFSFTVQLVSFMFVIPPVAILAVIGIKGESLFEYLFEVMFYKKKKRQMVFKMPRPAETETKKKFFTKKN